MADATPTTKFGRWRVKKRRELAIKLDALGPRLLVERPWFGRLYARVLAPRPSLRVFPGWTFGREFFVEHRWMATRRGILWRYSLRNGLDVRLVLPWHARTKVEVRLGKDWVSQAQGLSKKSAGQKAAQQILQQLTEWGR